MVSIQTVWIQINQLLKKLADQGLHCLSSSLHAILHDLVDSKSELYSLAKIASEITVLRNITF